MIHCNLQLTNSSANEVRGPWWWGHWRPHQTWWTTITKLNGWIFSQAEDHDDVRFLTAWGHNSSVLLAFPETRRVWRGQLSLSKKSGTVCISIGKLYRPFIFRCSGCYFKEPQDNKVTKAFAHLPIVFQVTSPHLCWVSRPTFLSIAKLNKFNEHHTVIDGESYG